MNIKKLLTNSRFPYLWGSQIMSAVTINIMNFLLLTRLYTETGSSIATSLLWVAYSLPALFFGPIGATTVDLFSRRKTLMITNLLQALAVLGFVFIHSQNIFILYALVLIYSLMNQFYVPAESAYLPSIVKKENLPQANSLFFITMQAAVVLGFGLAGVIQKVLGFDGAMLLCSLFLFSAFISVSFLEEIKPKVEISMDFESVLKTFFDSIIEGYTFIKNNKYALYPLLLLLGLQVTLTIIVTSLPIIAEQILGISVNYSGISVVVPAGIGATLGSFFVPRLLAKKYRKKIIIEYSLFAVVVAILSMTLGIPHLPVISRVIVTPLLIIMAGFGFVGVSIPTLTFLQSVTPHGLLGRVMGNLFFLTTVISLFPVLFSGAITEIFGIRTLLTIIAVGALSILVFSKNIGAKMIREDFAK